MKKTILMLLCLVCSIGAWADNYLPGSWNGWSVNDDVKFVDGKLTLNLEANTTYEFKIKDSGISGSDNNWYGNVGTMDYYNHTGWIFGGDKNCQITTKDAGEYTFGITWNGSTPTISVTYPNCIWNGCSFLGDGAQGGALNYKYMVSGINGVANIQHPGFATEDGIYIALDDAAFNKIVDEDGNELTYDVQGAGICLHISNFYRQVTTVTILNNETERWTFHVYYADGVIFVNTPSEYCDYEGSETEWGGKYVALTWNTNHSGNVVITMSNGTGATSCSFRNGGFEGGIDAFVVSTDDFATTEPASKYFTFEKVYGGNIATLVRIKPLPEGAKIKHVGEGHAFAWTVNGENAYRFVDFIYTYGSNTPIVEDNEAPTAFTAVVKSASYTSVTLTLQATDNVANKIYYTITDNNSNVYETNAPSGDEVDYVIKGLALNTSYTFSVVASDARENGNVTAAISNLQATTLEGATPATFYGVQSGVATSAYIGGVKTDNVHYDIYYSITRNADYTLTCNAFLAGDYANVNGLANGSVGYRGSIDWADFVKNPDGTRTRQTSKDTYEAYEGQGITCMFHFPAQEALINPYFDGYVVGAESAPYTRTTTSGNYGTLCLPFNAKVTGATLYTVAGVEKDGDAITGVVLVEVAGDLEAGKGYIFKATAGELSATYTSVAAHGVNDGLVGNISADNLSVPEGKYILRSNQVCPVVGDQVYVGQYRAYIDLEGVGEYQPSGAKAIRFGFDGSVDEDYEVSGIANVNAQVANGAAFNVAGQRVNANAKGIVIINGKKYFNK